jgi:hypothetical protein
MKKTKPNHKEQGKKKNPQGVALTTVMVIHSTNYKETTIQKLNYPHNY